VVCLIDTHILIWLLQDSPKLSTAARGLLQNPENELRLSVISLIEISIKTQKGKLQLKVPEEKIAAEAQNFGIRLLPLLPGHASAFRNLPRDLTDPFDRLLLASAIQLPMYFLTADRKLQSVSNLVIAA
jgi:PIN domain nuclease of toxin-antitoxin system